MYNKYDFDFYNKHFFMNNRLFCTFTNIDSLDFCLENIISDYTILYNKIFVLKVLENGEYVVTYNVETGNVGKIPEQTILVHRKKESNTLYSINALNILIKKLNDGVLDNSFRINWNEYRNSILLTQHNEFVKLETKLYKIVEI